MSNCEAIKHLLLKLPDSCKCDLCSAARRASMIASLQTNQYYWRDADKMKAEVKREYGE